MRTRVTVTVLVVIAAVLAGVVVPVGAHETETVEGYEITFGGADEPLITGERMWLEFEIVDNETDAAVGNQSENLTVSVQRSGDEKVSLDIGEKHGENGTYEAPVIFTEPGEYTVHLEGSLDGTDVHTHFETTVEDHTELEYPGNASESAADGEEADSRTDDGEAENAGYGSVGVAAAVALVAAAGGVLLGRR